MALFLFLNSCSSFTIHKPKIKVGAVVNPNFEGYALVIKTDWDINTKK